jgi:predicted XRE-type DNA-binding protein
MSKKKEYESVWDAIADTQEEAANLRARSELMMQIVAIIRANGWKQAEAATRCGVTQPLIDDLLRGGVSRFSLDALVNIATSLGRHVHIQVPVIADALSILPDETTKPCLQLVSPHMHAGGP